MGPWWCLVNWILRWIFCTFKNSYFHIERRQYSNLHTNKNIPIMITWLFSLEMYWENWLWKVKYCRQFIDKQSSKWEIWEILGKSPFPVPNIVSVQSYPFLSPILRHETGAVILRPGHRAGPGQWWDIESQDSNTRGSRQCRNEKNWKNPELPKKSRNFLWWPVSWAFT